MLMITIGSSSCGDEQPLGRRNFFHSPESAVAGEYRAQFFPVFSDCLSYQAIPLDYRVGIAQFGPDLIVDFGSSLRRNDFGRLVNVTFAYRPLEGPLFNDGGFDVLTQGVYENNTINLRADYAWQMSGFFDPVGFTGVSDVIFFDPALNSFCLVSHDVIAGFVR